MLFAFACQNEPIHQRLVENGMCLQQAKRHISPYNLQMNRKTAIFIPLFKH